MKLPACGIRVTLSHNPYQRRPNATCLFPKTLLTYHDTAQKSNVHHSLLGGIMGITPP